LKLNSEVLKIVEIETLPSPKKSFESLSNKIQNEHEIHLGDSTISGARHLLRFFYKSPKIRQNLTATQIQKIINFADTMFSSEEDFFRIIFSDESRICFGPDYF
jgi:hypothetical protein